MVGYIFVKLECEPAPLLLGRHLLELGVRPGPEVGRLLKQVYERQLDGEIRTLEDGLAAAEKLLRQATENPS